MKILKHNAEFVLLSDLKPESWDSSFFALISENAPYTWGDANRTLVTADRVLAHIKNTFYEVEAYFDANSSMGSSGVLEISGILEKSITYQEYLNLLGVLESLGDTYVDLEN